MANYDKLSRFIRIWSSADLQNWLSCMDDDSKCHICGLC